jgi:N-acetylglucosaminyldiphosphoundecaprenol N-acetyl-beta-D-mannosaminyltransferase
MSAIAPSLPNLFQDVPLRHDLFGYPIDAFEKDDLLRFVENRVATQRKTVVANLNLHALHCLSSNAEMESLLQDERTFVHIDGMPIVWMSKAKGLPVTRDNRLTYLDWAVDMLDVAARKGWKVAYLGSTKEINEAGIAHFRSVFSKLDMRGWDGFFDMDPKADDPKLVRTLQEIDAFAPDLLIVGMSMPRQEVFLHRYRDHLNFTVGVCAGAFLEYFVGGQKAPPRWTGRLGLEGLYRLVTNPVRYGSRYLLEPILLSVSLTKRMIRRRRFL